ncbi:MAG: polysaccharide pyruvyl transferase family protein [Gemmatimonadaceae bacterium]
MTLGKSAGERARSLTPPRVGLFGLLGDGNIGNDASMEAVLGFLRTHHPDALLDAMCTGPGHLADAYGIKAVRLYWHQQHEPRACGVAALGLKIVGKGIDVFRIANWVRSHDVVIVPGMGVLEASLPLRPWHTPYAMFLLCASGRLFNTKVALVSVGANMIHQRTTRWLFNAAARLAFYRSYRDTVSREAMRQRGIDTTRDRVYPDLVFSIPTPPHDPGDAHTIGVGVMAYYGTNDDRRHADQIYFDYMQTMKCLVRWLVDGGCKVRLFPGDTCDDSVVREILADLRERRPDLDAEQVVSEPVASFSDLRRAMEPVGAVIATRYHNVICALKLAKPTISLGYATKNKVVMTDAGLSEFCQSANQLNVDVLIEQFIELNRRSAQLKQTISRRNAVNAQLLDRQFAELSRLLFGSRTGAPTERQGAHAGASGTG